MVRLNLSSDGVRLNLSLDGVRNCTYHFRQRMRKNIECKEKSIFNLAYKQGLLFEKSNKPDKFRETYKKWSK